MTPSEVFTHYFCFANYTNGLPRWYCGLLFDFIEVLDLYKQNIA